MILEKRFVDVTRRYGIMEGYIKGWEVAFNTKAMDTSGGQIGFLMTAVYVASA